MKYGFIGLGNMAGAILRGMYRSGNFKTDTLLGFNRSEAKTLALRDEIGLVPCRSARDVAEQADVIVLAVKPQMLPDVLPELRDVVTPDKLVISIAAGKPTTYYEDAFTADVPVVRVMPNINAKVGLSASAVCAGRFAEEQHLELASRLFSAVGTVYPISEAQFAAFSAIAGASGAFIHLYIDALASAGVKAGFARPFAESLACQTVLGSATLTQQSDKHPIALMDEVCSPGGTTIEGVHTLKRLGFETAVQQAVQAIIEKDKILG